MGEEKKRLEKNREDNAWKKWGPYLSERQWGTVREDYSKDGSAWNSISHEQSRSKAYRWGEDGIGGFCDDQQRVCFSWAFWNMKDPILKERFFGLTGPEGNHGEDVKELYYYLDSSPTHSYMKMLYKYPQGRFPYEKLVENNVGRSKLKSEYEIIDTGVFDNNEYFDIFMEYAKQDKESFLFQATIHNRSEKEAELVVLPTLWFRNTWSSGVDKKVPNLKKKNNNTISLKHHSLGKYEVYFDDESFEELVFSDNETNREKIYGIDNTSEYCKDAFNEYLIEGELDAVNPLRTGTKAAGIYKLKIPANSSKTVRLKLTNTKEENAFNSFNETFAIRKQECDEFYGEKQTHVDNEDLRNIQRQAYGGMFWTKQFYYYNVRDWLNGDPGRVSPPRERKNGRNANWQHLDNFDIISMPDKWEYPWYAAWDLAFHCIPICRVDPDFAKDQLLLFLSERYLHPNGMIPAYEWDFSNVNPPVHAWAVMRVYEIDQKTTGIADTDFLQQSFHKLLLNFTWWVNRTDVEGNNIFEGGFLGLDNIGVFDRSHPIIEGSTLEQADSTGWMAMYSLKMMQISLELALKNPVYQDMAIKFLEHFLYIAGAINGTVDAHASLWDDEDNFYYDVMHTPDGKNRTLKIRSMVGLIPLFAVETLKSEAYKKLPEFRQKLEFFLQKRPKLASLVSRWYEPGKGERRLLALLRGYRMKKILERMLDPGEFLSDYGIRALSKYHEETPFKMNFDGQDLQVKYLPGESDSSFFGGNSNWRGPIWFPVNYLLLESLLRFHHYYGDDYKVEFPKGSKNFINILEVVEGLSERLMAIFKKGKNGERPVFGGQNKFNTDPHFKDYIPFYEYFNGDNGTGLGASHQTGWTGLIADIIHKYYLGQSLKKAEKKNE